MHNYLKLVAAAFIALNIGMSSIPAKAAALAEYAVIFIVVSLNTNSSDGPETAEFLVRDRVPRAAGQGARSRTFVFIHRRADMLNCVASVRGGLLLGDYVGLARSTFYPGPGEVEAFGERTVLPDCFKGADRVFVEFGVLLTPTEVGLGNFRDDSAGVGPKVSVNGFIVKGDGTSEGVPIGEFIDSITLLPGPTTPPAK